MREWTVHRQPCGWFRAGKNCSRRWNSFVGHHTPEIILAAGYVNVAGIAGLSILQLRRSRLKRQGRLTDLERIGAEINLILRDFIFIF